MYLEVCYGFRYHNAVALALCTLRYVRVFVIVMLLFLPMQDESLSQCISELKQLSTA